MRDTRSMLMALAAAGACWTLLQSPVPALAQSAATTGPKVTVDLWRPGDPGQRMIIHGRVLGPDGAPLAGALIHWRQTDGTGNYTGAYQTSFRTAEGGTYSVASVLPGKYYRLRHVHIGVSHEGHGSIQTEIVFKGDSQIDEARDISRAIILEEANVNGETFLLGEFNVQM